MMSITLNVERIILIILNLGWYLGLLCIKPVPENSREIVTISRDFPIPENSKSPGKITSLQINHVLIPTLHSFTIIRENWPCQDAFAGAYHQSSQRSVEPLSIPIPHETDRDYERDYYFLNARCQPYLR